MGIFSKKKETTTDEKEEAVGTFSQAIKELDEKQLLQLLVTMLYNDKYESDKMPEWNEVIRGVE